MGSSEADRLILRHLDDERWFFVFPSESAASAYASHVLGLGGVRAVRLDRFIAWDTFKQNAIKTARAGRRDGPPLKSVTPLMRKLFAARTLDLNARREAGGKAPFFTALIPAAYARYSPAFASWVADILPRLAAPPEDGAARQAPDSGSYRAGIRADLAALRALYQNFLRKNNLFESAWERPPFKSAGRRYFIFYPEALLDFAEYEPLLREAGPDAPLVNVPERVREPRAFFYKTAQAEVAEAALYILGLRKGGAAYTDIIVTSPSLNEYEPYIEKEFANRGIPLAGRNGKNLSEYPAGRLFSCIQDCYTKKFSFESVAALLANRALPWKEHDQINKLIDFGLRNNCACSWEEPDGAAVDVWKHARLSPEDISVFYTDLKACVTALCRAKTFAGVKRRYFAFRGRFLGGGMGGGDESDDVIARCVSELAVLAGLEKTYPALKNAAPFAFWVRHLGETIYTPQTRKTGVTLLPYRIAAATPAAYHVVLGAEQGGMAQTDARARLLAAYAPGAGDAAGDERAGEIFFNLHNATARNEAVFFCSERTFSGFAIPFGLLDVSGPRARYGESSGGAALFYGDLVAAERERLGAVFEGAAHEEETDKKREYVKNNDTPFFIHTFQKQGFGAFAARNARPPEGRAADAFAAGGALTEAAAKRYCGVKDGRNAFFVSESALKPFYECSLKWLFSRVLAVRELDTEARVSDPFVWGDAYHLVLNEFFIYIKNENMAFAPGPGKTLSPAFADILGRSVDSVFGRLDDLTNASEIKKTLMRPQKDEARKRLARTLASVAYTFAGYKVLLAEEKLTGRFSYEGKPCEINGYDIYMDGKPDLVLDDGAGNLAIVDFKSAAPPSKESCFGAEADGRLADFQMPMYHALLREERGLEARTGCFVSIRDAEVKTYFSPAPSGGRSKTAAFDDTAAALEQQISEYAKSALECDIEAYISKRFNICVSCTYKHVCRSAYAIKRGIYGA